MAPKLANILLTNVNGSPLEIPEPVRAMRRALLAFSLLGHPGTTKARWTCLIVSKAWQKFQRDGCAFCRGVVHRFHAIHDDPEGNGADSDEELTAMGF